MSNEVVLHVEICQCTHSILKKSIIEEAVKNEIFEEGVLLNIPLYGKSYLNPILHDHVEFIVCSANMEKHNFEDIRYYTYRMMQESNSTETMSTDSGELSVASHWLLPAREFHNIWENLYFNDNIKEDLLRFAETILLFSDHNIDPNIISCNKVILLYGPPGTGKTSMCKALAQKVAIRMGDRFNHGELIEINSHSLFSKWFSESGKLVTKLFDDIKIMVQNEKILVCILIDEVESLAHARKLCVNGTEPSDSIRVVNALLTQLDQIKQYPNVFILTTSNMTEAIDLAFIDRADVKQYLGYPCIKAIYGIYRSCLKELMRREILEEEEIHEISEEAQMMTDSLLNGHAKLMEVSNASIGLTGRTMRKIPFLTCALHLPTSFMYNKITVSTFLDAMRLTIIQQKKEMQK